MINSIIIDNVKKPIKRKDKKKHDLLKQVYKVNSNQLNYRKNVIDEFQERVDTGEEDINIKYKRNVQIII